MPLTPKQEAFCRAYVETGNASEAYRRAYDAGGMKPAAVQVNASKLLSHAKVALWLQEQRELQQSRHNITLDRLTDMAIDAYNRAKAEEGDAFAASAMVKAIAQLSKMHGFDAKERENDRMAVGDALAMIEARRKEAEADAGTVH